MPSVTPMRVTSYRFRSATVPRRQPTHQTRRFICSLSGGGSRNWQPSVWSTVLIESEEWLTCFWMLSRAGKCLIHGLPFRNSSSLCVFMHSPLYLEYHPQDSGNAVGFKYRIPQRHKVTQRSTSPGPSDFYSLRKKDGMLTSEAVCAMSRFLLPSRYSSQIPCCRRMESWFDFPRIQPSLSSIRHIEAGTSSTMSHHSQQLKSCGSEFGFASKFPSAFASRVVSALSYHVAE